MLSKRVYKNKENSDTFRWCTEKAKQPISSKK